MRPGASLFDDALRVVTTRRDGDARRRARESMLSRVLRRHRARAIGLRRRRARGTTRKRRRRRRRRRARRRPVRGTAERGVLRALSRRGDRDKKAKAADDARDRSVPRGVGTHARGATRKRAGRGRRARGAAEL